MKKIVKGNDFTLRIPVAKMVEGQQNAFPLPACTDVVVQVCNQFKRIPLAFEVDVKEDNVLLAKVEGDKISIGTYAIEVKGKIFGNDWRSNEYPQFAIVSNNADADTEFGETDEGDNSVEMDTAMVILPPSVELSDLIDKANEVLKNNKEINDTLNANEEARKEAETQRVSAETERVKAEKKRQSDTSVAIGDMNKRIETAISELNTHRTELDKAEAQRVSAEKERVDAEITRKQAETDRAAAEDARVEAEQSRADAEIKRKSDFDTAIKAAETATTGAEKVNATLTEENVFEVTGRTGVKKTLDMSGLVSAQSDVARIQESMGAYSDRPDITLVAKETNKAISADGVKVTKAGWAIAEFTAEKGNIYLFKPNEVDGDVCIFAEEITNIETRGIDYTYTYNADGTIETAKATYLGATHIYTFSYAEDKSYTITDEAGETVEALPMTYETKVGSYSPLVRLNADAELPIDGYCRYMSHFKGNSSIKIVVSYKIDAADLVMKVVRDGVFASISTQLGNLSQKEDETRKKIEELHGSSYADVMFRVDSTVSVDGKQVLIKGKKKIRIFPKSSIYFNGTDSKFPTLVWADIENLRGLSSIDTQFYGAFFNCKMLKSIKSGSLDVSKVTRMYRLFYGCSSLQSIDLSAWDVSKVTNMSGLFYGCSSLQSIDLSAWDVSKVTNMSGLFDLCASLRFIDLSGWCLESCENILFSQWDMYAEKITLGKDFFKTPAKTARIYSAKWVDYSVKKSLVVNSYDRKANGLPDLTLTLHANTKKVLSEDDMAAITAKGYIIA